MMPDEHTCEMNTPAKCVAAIAILVAASCGPAHAQARRNADSFAAMTVAQLKTGIEKQHPAAFYVLAKKLFEQGERDEAVFWFYAGQLRYRAYLSGHPQLPRDGDPALFASLSEVVGKPINVYAFGDIPALAKTIDRVLAWDVSQPDAFNKAPEREQSRNGLSGMKAHVEATADEIRATRTKNGLENRGK